MLADIASPGMGEIIVQAYRSGVIDGGDATRQIFQNQGLITEEQASEALRQHIRDARPDGDQILDRLGLNTPANPLEDVKDIPDFPTF